MPSHTPPPAPPPPPPLLRLPLELRHQIYTHLQRAAPLSYPLPGAALTSVAPRPPPLALLQASRQVGGEALAHWYARATWTLRLAHAFNLFRRDAALAGLRGAPQLARLRRVAVVFAWAAALPRDYPSFGARAWAAALRERCAALVRVLAERAAELRVVVVGWVDTVGGAWEEKRGALEPLRELRGVTFEVGEVVVVDEGIGEAVRRAVAGLARGAVD